MSSIPVRDQKQDHLLTPENSVLIIIDYQKVQVNSIDSMDRQLLINNISAVAKMAKVYNIPIILSTVNVETGFNTETIPQLRKELENVPSYDRTTINAWEDKEFLAAVKAAGRRKLLMAALW